MKRKKISQCTESKYREFPDLLFGQSQEDDLSYFDATNYLTIKEIIDENSIKYFERKVELFLNAISEVDGILHEDLIIKDMNTGHIMIEESLSLLFVAYVNPDFAVYLLERVSELLIRGFVLSDSAIAVVVKERFSSDDLKKIYQN